MEKITQANYEPLDNIGFDQTLAKVGHVNRVIDEVNNLQPTYAVYTALLTQTAGNAPVATVLQNTLGGTVVWTRNGAGDYVATLTGAFTAGKTAVLKLGDGPDLIVAMNALPIYFAYRIDANTVGLATADSAGLLDDDLLGGNMIEIRVYA